MDEGVEAAATVTAPARLRLGRTGSLRLALVLMAFSALVLGVVQLGLGAVGENPYWIPASFTAVFWIWATAGVIAWWRRPSSAIGALLVLGSLAVFLAGIGNLGVPTFVVLSAVFGSSILAVTVHLLLAFPSGRVLGRISRTVVITGYAVALVLQAPLYLVPPDAPMLRSALELVQSVVGLAVMVATVVILVNRLRSTDRANLRVLIPLYVYGSLAAIGLPMIANVGRVVGADAAAIGALQLVLTAGIPVAFLLGVLLGGFTRTTEADALSAWLGAAGSTRAAVARALSRSLGDDSLRVVYWSADSGYVDEHGVEVPAGADSHRLRQPVRVESRLVGAIDYDSRMVADPEAVRRAGQVLALALDRERLTAELMASNEALQLSRLRLVETADRERTRIARDLHDGLQVQLVLLALEAQQIANDPAATAATSEGATALRVRIDSAAADLRRLVHDVLPSALVERGLTAAVEDLVDRLDFPATLETDVADAELAPATSQSAYLIVAEALTNAVKHSSAQAVTVELRTLPGRLLIVVVDDGRGGARVEDGSGLKGLADRVDALGGRFELTSVDDEGTELRVELPCVS